MVCVVYLATKVDWFVSGVLTKLRTYSALVRSGPYGVATISGLLKIIGLFCRT